jgi:hypothetical protein
MKEELQTALADLISKTLQGVDASKDFLTSEIPDVIEQLLMWHGIYSFIVFMLMAFWFMLAIYFNVKQYKFWKNIIGDKEKIKKLPRFLRLYNGEEVEWGVVVPLNLIQLLHFIPLVFMIENLAWLQIWIAPKVWLIEYMGRLVK